MDPRHPQGDSFFFMVGVTERDLSELLFQRDRGIDDVRVEMLPPTFYDEVNRLGMSERRLVHTFVYERMVIIRHGHDPPRQRDCFAAKPVGVSRSRWWSSAAS
ncbi:MAG: hypothetical protein O3A51_03185, partial [Verrucomicrobia bacterium]|nr:hypothetical protein [Verrucomicrobiota bacterium]